MASTEFGPVDPNSYSRPDLAVVTDISIHLSVNFAQKIFSGNVNLTVKKLQEDVNEVVLDAKDLNITNIYESDLNNEKLKFTISEPVEEFGSKLTIELPPKESNVYNLSIHYSTSPKASGLQWLSPEQTSGKQLPFMFSQFQAIHARSFLPCQDTPYVKTKYNAVITSPNNMVVLMSAIRKDYREVGVQTFFHFVQDIPVPSYLIAIAIGALESRKVGPRSHVWAEKEVIDQAAYEFVDTDKQLQSAEEICGPYVWGIYDLLVLPPSFPYGGMENPCLTFVTPTLLAGDRSLSNVIAHEISHSWTGNLITNKNFEHFWLNEGFTMFIERKIRGKLGNKEIQDFEAKLGLSELKETVERLGDDDPMTKLVLNLTGVNPDDAYSLVPYEKGYTFLRYLENVVGGPELFEPFLRKYFDTYKYKSIDSNDFKNFFINYFKENEKINEVDWKTWLHGTGMPPVIPHYDNTLEIACNKLEEKVLDWNRNGSVAITPEDFQHLSIDQKIFLLETLMTRPEPLQLLKVKELENIFSLKDTQNAELKFRWLRICLKAHWEEKVEDALKWINVVGRMKYVRPIYRDLYDWEFSRARAIENYKANKKYMMQMVVLVVAKDLHLEE